MRLVDASLPFQVVYAIYHHEYLGYLISSHVVQKLPNQRLSLIHQGIYPESMKQFNQQLNESDHELIRLAAEISPKAIIRKFGGNPLNPIEFFTKKFQGETQRLIKDYIQRRLSKIIPLLHDKEIYEMGNDGYPAQSPISFVPEKATVLFHFKRYEDRTHYYPTIKLRGEKIDFQYKQAAIVCQKPAWLLLNGELFTFEKSVEGNKLKPFLNKWYIGIPREKEQEYYQKFITRIVEKYSVKADGFQIRSVKCEPCFALVVKNHGSSFSFFREVDYSGHSIPLDHQCKSKVLMDYNEEKDDYLFLRIVRDCEREKIVSDFFQQIQPNPDSLAPWEFVPKEQGLSWLAKYTESIRSQGIEILQENDSYQINLKKPEILLQTQEAGDWFDIKAIVKIGGFEIPFVKFRKHILKNIREYILPDNTIAILPEEWFSDYRHLLEVSEQRNGDDTLSIKRYQAPLLNFPSLQKDLKKSFSLIQKLDEIPKAEPPVHLKAQLRNYQASGYDWLCFMQENYMGGILADDMGLGKTLQALTLLQREKEKGTSSPSLVVMPTSLIHNWRKEAGKFTPQLKVKIHSGISRKKDPEGFLDYDIILTSYGIVRQDIKWMKGFPFHYVILDESQMIKNPESKTARAVRTLIAQHRLSLTGTPIENTVMDIWSQMSFLNPGLLGNEAFFRKFYVSPIEKDKDEVRSAKLKRIIYPFILRRKKEQVEADLPPKIEKLHYCEMSEVQQEFYEETRSTYRNYLMDLISQGTWKKNRLNILAGLQKLRQIAIHPQMVAKEEYDIMDSGKYQEIKRILQVVLNRKSKVLIFSQFVKMLHLLRDDLDKEEVPYFYLDGGTRNRQDLVDKFQTDKSVQVFLISLKAGGVGLNLTAADYVFILDPWWNPAVENQAVDRSHRIGQKKTVMYYKFITQGSIEEKILQLQQRKAQLSDDIISVEEEVYKSLSDSDLRDLLEDIPSTAVPS